MAKQQKGRNDMKNMRKIVSIVMASVMVLALNCTAFAAEESDVVVDNETIEKDIEDINSDSTFYSTYLLNDAGTFNVYYYSGTFTVSSKTSVTFIVAVRGLDTTNGVYFYLSNSSGTTIYSTISFSSVSTSSSKASSATVTLPAGTYMVTALGTANYSHSVKVYY